MDGTPQHTIANLGFDPSRTIIDGQIQRLQVGRMRRSYEWLRRHPAELSMIASALITIFAAVPIQNQIDAASGDVYRTLVGLNHGINGNPVGHGALELAQYLVTTFSNVISQTHEEEVPLVQLTEFLLRTNAYATLIGPLFKYIGPGLAETLFKTGQIRKDQGIEPLRADQVPDHVFIASSQVGSDLAQAYALRTHSDKLYISIHIDPNVPPVYGQEIDRHFKAGSIDEILGRHAFSALPFITASGIDRAKEITIACVNPDNAIFYGAKAKQDFPPSFVSTLIRAIPKEQLQGKKINVILSSEEYFGETTPIEEELNSLKEQYGFELNIVKLETKVIDSITELLQKIVPDNQSQEPIEIVLAGEGKDDPDKEMLHRFSDVLNTIKIGKRQIHVTLLDHSQLGEIKTQERKERLQELKQILEKSVLNLCYGDTDTGTSTVAELLIKSGSQREHTLALVERMNSAKDFAIANIPWMLLYKFVIS